MTGTARAEERQTRSATRAMIQGVGRSSFKLERNEKYSHSGD
jgi:hypothetical protein